MTEKTAPDPPVRLAERFGLMGLALDLVMLGLAVVNLSWLIFDAIWAVEELRAVLAWVIPSAWLAAYAPVHDHFFRIDLVFVSIFLAEFLLRWGEALWSRRYQYWFAYPVLHWYDILGCIPVAGLRWLRILRIFAILIRLQHLGWIDYRQWALYCAIRAVYDVILEEISDRVVIRVLGGVQEEIRASGPLERKIFSQVIQPREAELSRSLRARLVPVLQQTYREAQADIEAFITGAVSRAVHANREIKLIDKIPLVGGMAGQLLDHAITDIVCRVIEELAGRLSSAEFDALFDEICHAVIEALKDSAGAESDQLTGAVNDIIDLIKEQVGKRRWLEASGQ